MEDPKLEADIKRVNELIQIWQEYYSLLLAAFDKERQLPPDADQRFQRVKNVVAERHDQFSDVIKKDHYVAQNILQMVKRTISIFDFEKASPVAIDKTLIEWHDANLLLYETLGTLEYERHKLGKISESELKKEESKKKRKAAIEKITGNRELFLVLKYLLYAAIAAGLWFTLKEPAMKVPFVRSRVNDLREMFRYEPLPDLGEEAPAQEGGEGE
ncbi:MAG: hypothetical protein KC931_06925 [Candidatus Omnitrophica bacterium]|nr:hypothetical protein [Candidatus Omnitrophota bacterium]MCA9418376.1 hypothetical protein [Candidatus Omnitrophota bacterium]MCA9425376.1 hypothetical protein [Candidatus Omnitrophota bacterium]MCA9430754.1 hypothetical protein [Candidatus Omnitrophota bacterium]MCA9437657.1 hypothetical protein [Candidatus Omnitrophota bacterium]